MPDSQCTMGSVDASAVNECFARDRMHLPAFIRHQIIQTGIDKCFARVAMGTQESQGDTQRDGASLSNAAALGCNSMFMLVASRSHRCYFNAPRDYAHNPTYYCSKLSFIETAIVYSEK